jgi:hypothetical protein
MKRRVLEERVLVMEERLKLFEPAMRAEFELADAKAGALAAENRLQRTLTNIRKGTMASVVASAICVAAALIWG